MKKKLIKKLVSKGLIYESEMVESGFIFEDKTIEKLLVLKIEELEEQTLEYEDLLEEIRELKSMKKYESKKLMRILTTNGCEKEEEEIVNTLLAINTMIKKIKII